MTRIHTVTAYTVSPLHNGWELFSTAPGRYQSPAQFEFAEQNCLTATVPGTVIETLRHHQQWDLEHPTAVDTLDWWYHCSFDSTVPEGDRQVVLKFAGLSTLANVWLNGQHIIATDNMFRTYEVDATNVLRQHNQLYIHFSALQPLLAKKRPRPHWRTQLVDHQQLRWFRTTLLGRMPSWSPPIQAIGPWQAITLEERTLLAIDNVSLRTTMHDDDGNVNVQLTAHTISTQQPRQATIIIGDKSFALDIHPGSANYFTLSAEIHIAHVQRWWPHTHGSQPLYPAKIVLRYPESTIEIDCGKIAFRTIALADDAEKAFGLRVNDLPIFCRGACWTPLNMFTLTGDEQAYRAALQLAQQAGFNMIRVGGTMVYEDDLFYDLCDELGILVWQDFMFANMDYPTTHADFRANCDQECEQLLQRLQTHPCLALLCGNNEIEQQVAMLGLPAETWQNDYFDHELGALCQRYIDVPYWPSTPHGGKLPFQPDSGNAHYQGVGTFFRPLEDARHSNVHFATECLGFANIPEPQTIDRFVKPGEMVTHHPKWKARVPRDAGANWDFEDVRDHYLQLLFQVDPGTLRYSDMERYLELGRVTSGEVMAYVFAEWRRKSSVSNGGLVWFYRDFWPATGWGLIDATGYPKAAYYYLRRVSLAQSSFFSDEGLNGLWLHIMNDRENVLPIQVRLSLYRFPDHLLETSIKDVEVASHDELTLQVDELLGGFRDLTYAYRFGPPGYDVIVATITKQAQEQRVSQSFYFPRGLASILRVDPGLNGHVSQREDGTYSLTIRTERFAQSVAIRTEQCIPEDNYFHMEPTSERIVTLFPIQAVNTFRCSLTALNAYHEIDIRF